MLQHSLLQTAIKAAQAGEEVIKHYYQGNIDVHLKTDKTPVTVADLETEKAISKILQEGLSRAWFLRRRNRQEPIS